MQARCPTDAPSGVCRCPHPQTMAARSSGCRPGTGSGGPPVLTNPPGCAVGGWASPSSVPTKGWLASGGGHRPALPRVVGWAMNTSPDTDLVLDAILMAFSRRRLRPAGHPSLRSVAGPTSLAFSQRPGRPRWSPSRSDPPQTRSITPPWRRFLPPPRRELAWIHQRTSWPTRDLLRSALFDDIEGFSNPTRTQRRLGYHSLPPTRTSP